MKKLIVILYVLPLFGWAQFDVIDTANFDLELLDSLILEEVNKLRKRKRADSLIFDQSLNEASQDHAQYMADEEDLTHTQKSKIKRSPYDRVIYYGGTHSAVGENIQAVNLTAMLEKSKYRLTYQKLAKEIVENWEKSKEHYENMINPQFTGISHGFALSGDHLLVCQVFASTPFDDKYSYVPGEPFYIKNEKPCLNCKRVKKKIYKDEAFLGWYTVSGDSIYYWNVDFYGKKHNLRKVFSARGKIAIDVIHQEQFDCNGNASFHNSPYRDGYYIGYVDKHVIENQDMHPGDNIVQIYVGMKPEFVDTFFQVDFNYNKRNRSCMNNMTIYVSPDHLKPHEYFEIPKPEIGLNKEIIIRDSVELRINFERNQTDQDTSIFQPLVRTLDSLTAANHQIDRIYFTGVASIEGSHESNEKLFTERGEIIESYLKRYYPDLPLHKEFYENFDDFRSGLAALGIRDLINASDDTLRRYVNEHKNEPMYAQLLDETRYSSVRIVYKDVIPVQPGSYGMSVQRISDLADQENFKDLTPLYQVMAHRAIEGDKSLQDSLLALTFPSGAAFSKLNWYQFVLELTVMDLKVSYERLNELYTMGAIPSDADFLEYRLLFNIFYGQQLINVDDFGEVHDGIKSKKQKAWIESLELIMGVQNYRYSHAMVVPILMTNTLKKKFDLKQTYFICQFLIEWGYTSEPYLLLSKFAKRPGQLPKLYKQYLKLAYFLGFFENKKEWKTIRVVMKNLAESYPSEFCDLFKWEQMGVRALAIKDIAVLFCEKCRN